jgi:hypothetical protein
MRREAAALRSDINEAQTLIDRLRRRYLDGSELALSANVTGRADHAEPPTG